MLHLRRRKEVIMRDFRMKGLAFIVVLGFVFSWICVSNIQAAQKTSNKKININTASVDELQKLPRIGAQVAQRIVDFRKEHGRFNRIEDLMKVRGIGESTFSKLKNLITVGQKPKKE